MKRYVVEYGHNQLGRPKRRYFDSIPEAEVFTSAYYRRRGDILGIEPTDHYANYDREPVRVFDDLTKRLKELGFKKVMYHCAYEGPVAQLIEELKAAGWKKERGHRNPFLLRNPKSSMVLNFAETNRKPSSKYLSYF